MSGHLQQHLSETGTFFCSVTHDLKLAEEMIKALPDFKNWAYIYHEADTDEGTPHYHFLVRANGTRSVKQIADKLGISGQYVQVCRKVVAFRRYMMHLDSDDKIQYSVHDVKTNCHSDFRSAMEGNQERDVYDLFRDFCSLSKGTMTPDEFIQLNFVEFSKMAFSQKIKTFQILNDVSMKRALTT